MRRVRRPQFDGGGAAEFEALFAQPGRMKNLSTIKI
jgi:hypothetical protein